MNCVYQVVDCIFRWKVEIATTILLVLGQLLILYYQIQQRKYSNKPQNAKIEYTQKKTENDEFKEIDSQQKVRIMNKLIKLGKINEAEEIVNQIDKPETYIYTIQMKGYTKNKDLSKAQSLMNQMQNSNNKPNLVTYNTYLTCAIKSQNLKEAKQIFDLIQEKDVITYTTYIRGLLKCKQVEEAIQIHESVIKQSQLVLDQMYFNILINGLIKNKKVDYAYNVYIQMKDRNFEQNEYSITVLIQLFNKLSNQKFNDILKNFKQKDKQFYSQIVQSLFKNPQYLQKATDVLKNTMSKNIVLKKSVYESAINSLYRVISNQIILEAFSTLDAQKMIVQILEYVRRKNIKIKNESLIQITQSSFYQIIQQQHYAINLEKKHGIFNRCET